MKAALARMKATATPRARAIVNATGVILHTNLGRALLSVGAQEAAAEAAARPINLELNLSSGNRGNRDDLIRDNLIALTGAEDATVANNNAAALLLAINSLAENKEIVVSRGELIEIGGSFRLPEIIRKTGARLHEVGTTNRTHAKDYEDAIDDSTALLLKVHTSNYKVLGFSSDVSLEELVDIGKRRNIPVMEDLGSGALIDLSQFGLPKEPIVAERVKAGAAVVTFSGDKLLGGPQCGIIVGRQEVIKKVNANPLKRALRCDKMTLAALSATLNAYRCAPKPEETIPTLFFLSRSLDDLVEVGSQALQMLSQNFDKSFDLDLIDSKAEAGSGSMPLHEIPSKTIRIQHQSKSAEEIAYIFRSADPPILGRIHKNAFLLDLRTITNPQDLIPRSRL